MSSRSNIQGIIVNDPTKVIGITPSTNTTYYAGSEVEKLQKQLDDQALTIKLMTLKILCIEGKFTQEEISNIRKMLMSEDEASRTLANSIIENA